MVEAPGGKEGPLSPESKLALGELGDEDPLLGLTRDCKRNGDASGKRCGGGGV